MAAATAIVSEFGPAFVRGLAELGPFPAPGDDLSLELGLSIWLFESGIAVDEAHEVLRGARRAMLVVAGVDADSEPVPFIGRASESDLVRYAAYLDALLVRVAGQCGRDVSEVAGEVVGKLRPHAVVPSVAC
jgi:hypothetical protein